MKHSGERNGRTFVNLGGLATIFAVMGRIPLPECLDADYSSITPG